MRYFYFAALFVVGVLAISTIGGALQSSGGLLAQVVGSINSGPLTSTSSASNQFSGIISDPIQQLQSEIDVLGNNLNSLRTQVELNSLRLQFNRTLKRGDSGNDVTLLQKILSKNPELYPTSTEVSSTISGFYGNLTQTAVNQIQSLTGLPQTGVFDQLTLKELISYQNGGDGANAAGMSKVDISSVSSLENELTQIESDISNNSASITDLENRVGTLETEIGSASEPPPVPANTTPTITLSISGVAVGSIGNNTATVTWTTNEPASSEVDYSINSTLSSGVSIVSSSTQVSNHSMTLKSLSSNTKYYYRVLSTDSSGNTQNSAIQSFSTTH